MPGSSHAKRNSVHPSVQNHRTTHAAVYDETRHQFYAHSLHSVQQNALRGESGNYTGAVCANFRSRHRNAPVSKSAYGATRFV